MEWLDSVLTKDKASGRKNDNIGTHEQQVEIIRVNDDNVLFTDLTEMINELKNIKQGPLIINQNEVKEYKKLMSTLLPKKSSDSMGTNRTNKHTNIK